MPIDRNAIGTHGEAIVMNLLTRRHDRHLPLFRPHFLGDKYPTIDVFVELLNVTGPQSSFFLAQIKTTTTGYSPTGRLQVRVGPDELHGLRRYPVPVYVIGVDEVSETAYLVAAVEGGKQQIRSVPTTHRLNDSATLLTLHDEVDRFWRDQDIRFTQSAFAEEPG